MLINDIGKLRGMPDGRMPVTATGIGSYSGRLRHQALSTQPRRLVVVKQLASRTTGTSIMSLTRMFLVEIIEYVTSLFPSESIALNGYFDKGRIHVTLPLDNVVAYGQFLLLPVDSHIYPLVHSQGHPLRAASRI